MTITKRIIFAVLGLVSGLILGPIFAIIWMNTHPQDFDTPVMGFVIIGLLVLAAMIGAIVGIAVGVIVPLQWERRKLLRQSQQVPPTVLADDETTWPPTPQA